MLGPNDFAKRYLAVYRQLYDAQPLAVDALPHTVYFQNLVTMFQHLTGEARTPEQVYGDLQALRRIKYEDGGLKPKGRDGKGRKPLAEADDKLIRRIYAEFVAGWDIPLDRLPFRPEFWMLMARFNADPSKTIPIGVGDFWHGLLAIRKKGKIAAMRAPEPTLFR